MRRGLRFHRNCVFRPLRLARVFCEGISSDYGTVAKAPVSSQRRYISASGLATFPRASFGSSFASLPSALLKPSRVSPHGSTTLQRSTVLTLTTHKRLHTQEESHYPSRSQIGLLQSHVQSPFLLRTLRVARWSCATPTPMSKLWPAT